jgi:hypothetical protein
MDNIMQSARSKCAKLKHPPTGGGACVPLNDFEEQVLSFSTTSAAFHGIPDGFDTGFFRY